MMFYVPHWIWKNLEDGKMRSITEGLRGMVMVPEDYRKDRQRRIIKYLVERIKTHNGYSIAYYACEVLNFINVIGNIFMVNKFLGGSFMTYGTEVLKFVNMDQEKRFDPMIEVFPRVTKCNFYKFGSGGSVEKHDSMCVLALNVLNEKIYIFLWFWFIILSVITGLAVVHSFFVILMPATREKIIKRSYRLGQRKEIHHLIRRFDLGDFFILHLMGQNLNTKIYSEILHELCTMLSNSRTPSASAPSTLEMNPIYPHVDHFGKETET